MMAWFWRFLGYPEDQAERNTPSRPTGLLDGTWRDPCSWDERAFAALREETAALRPGMVNGVRVKHYRILLVGQIGAGKSSFFNSVKSIFRGHITTQAVSGEGARSMTSTFRVYDVRMTPGSDPLPWKICDTMGLSRSEEPEVHHLLYLSDGNVPDRTELGNRFITPDDEHFRQNPSVEDKAHCVAFVIDASKVDVMDRKVWEKLQEFQKALNSRAVPVVVLLTHIDKACHHVKGDLASVFESEKIREAVQRVSRKLNGLQENHIFPIKNYENETELKVPNSILILRALRQMLQFSQCYLDENMPSSSRFRRLFHRMRIRSSRSRSNEESSN